MELTPFLNKDSSEPLYSQLYHWIKKEIDEERLLPGMKMPSIRQLALHLKVSRNTVDTAYQQLISEGYLESISKSGIWVSEIEKPALDGIEKNFPIKQESNTSYEHLINFEYGNLDIEKFPIKKWKKCISDVVSQENNWLFEYGEKQGELELRKEIAKYLIQSRGVNCSPDQIVITSGTQNSISLICQLLNLHQEKIAIEEPSYDGVRKVFENKGCFIETVPLEKDGISVDHIKLSESKAVYITPSHQFPLGMILPISKRMQLLNWAYQTGGYIIEDDYDSEFRYRGQPIPSLKSLDEEERVIYLGTFSKSFLPSVRLSYIILPPTLLSQYLRKFSHYSQSVSPIIQRAMALYMESGEFEKHIRRMRKVYQRKHQTLLKSIEQNLSTKVEIIGENSGLHILLKLNNISSIELIETAKQKGVKVYSPLKFWLNPSPESNYYVMLGFGGLSIEEIEKGIKILASCIP